MKDNYRFMVVDDDPVNNLICKHMILKYNPAADIRLYTDPKHALENMVGAPVSLDDQPNTILFLDINMPSMSGWEFLAEFEDFKASVRSQFKIFILSSSIDYLDRQRSDDNRFVSGFLSKPLRLENIRNLVIDI